MIEIKQQPLVIVGGDSRIGRQLIAECGKTGASACASTRRTKAAGPGRFFLDLTASRPAEFLPDGGGPVLIVAAKTGYDACEGDPASAKTNIYAPVQLAEAALSAGRRIIFVSTSSVFGGDLPRPSEDANAMPQAAYSKQKAEAEHQLRKLPGWSSYGSIVRLTKVLAPSTSPLPAWRDALTRGESISPFSDMVFAPISLQFAARSLIRIAFLRCCGNFHLSGADDVTYAEFARQYVEAHKLNSALVVPTTADKTGVDLLFRRRYSALDTARTLRLTKIAPQSMGEVIADLLNAEQSARETP